MEWRRESNYVKQSAFADDEKEFLKLAKKLRDILKLEEKSANGEKLAQNQLDKLSSKTPLLKEVTALAVKLPGDTDVIEKNQDVMALLPPSAVRDIEKKRKQEQERKEARKQREEEERNKPVFMCRHERPILGVCMSADSRYLFTCSKDKYLICWDTSQKLLKAVVTFAGHTGAVFAVDVCSSPAQLISGSADGKVMLWEGDPARHTHFTVASPWRTLDHGGIVRVLRWCPPEMEARGSGGYAASGSPASGALRRFASASEKLGSKPPMIAVWTASSKGEMKQLFEIKDLPTKANDLQWGGGAKLKLFSAHDNGYVGVWLAEGDSPGSLLKTIKLHDGPVSALMLAAGGSTLVTASHDKTSKAVDITSPAMGTLATWEWNRPLNAVTVSADFKAGPDGAGVVVIGGGKDARDVTRAKDLHDDEFDSQVMDAVSGEVLGAGSGHIGPVHALLSLPRHGPGGAFATVSEDGCLRIHSLEGELVHSDTLS
eukprot:TRINITY_DN48049_c0_g1_i1.p1 TRINITY_DN48049_c0_g1~~TRINITY_DN48049_c0_g1_i1.p1  ORF type:complete len:487 (+),score=128.52 TRINITY_DN48049_c0_g1_i1:154-1614(+)